MLKYLVAAAVAATLLPVAAEAREPVLAVHVAYRDLDLNSPAGVRILDRRISAAVEQLCPDVPRVGIIRNLAVEKCRTATQATVAHQRAAVLADAARGNIVLATR